MEIAPGAFHLRGVSRSSTSVALVEAVPRADRWRGARLTCPIVRGGGKMHVRMLCLGRHWNGKTYRYEPTRSITTSLPCRRCPASFASSRARLRRRRHDARRRPLHPQLLRRRRPHGTAPGQGRERRVARGRRAGRVGVARRHGAVSVRRDCAVAIRSRRSRSSRATRSSSAVRRGCAITASRGIVPGTAPPELGLTGRFNLTFRRSS